MGHQNFWEKNLEATTASSPNKCDPVPEAKTKHLGLTDLMLALGLNNKALAADIEVTPNTVSNWVNGHNEVPKVVLRYLQLRLDVFRRPDPVEAFIQHLVDRAKR